jgi:hypothetical protein
MCQGAPGRPPRMWLPLCISRDRIQKSVSPKYDVVLEEVMSPRRTRLAGFTDGVDAGNTCPYYGPLGALPVVQTSGPCASPSGPRVSLHERLEYQCDIIIYCNETSLVLFYLFQTRTSESGVNLMLTCSNVRVVTFFSAIVTCS